MVYVCQYCKKEFSTLRGLQGHTRFVHNTNDYNYVELEDTETKAVVSKDDDTLLQTYDKSVVRSDYISQLKEHRDALLLEREIERLSQPIQPQQQLSPRDMIDMFNSMLQSMTAILQQQKQTSLLDELEKYRALREISDELSSGASESIEDSILKEGIKTLLLKQQMNTTPHSQIIINEPQSDIDFESMLTDETISLIKKTPKSVAWKFISKYIKISKEEFDKIYDSIRSKK